MTETVQTFLLIKLVFILEMKNEIEIVNVFTFSIV